MEEFILLFVLPVFVVGFGVGYAVRAAQSEARRAYARWRRSRKGD